ADRAVVRLRAAAHLPAVRPAGVLPDLRQHPPGADHSGPGGPRGRPARRRRPVAPPAVDRDTAGAALPPGGHPQPARAGHPRRGGGRARAGRSRPGPAAGGLPGPVRHRGHVRHTPGSGGLRRRDLPPHPRSRKASAMVVRRRPVLAAGALTPLLALAACAADDPDQDETTADLPQLTLGLTYVPNVQFAPFYLAEQKGYFTDAGVDVTLRHHGESEDLFGALRSGTEDLVVA